MISWWNSLELSGLDHVYLVCFLAGLVLLVLDIILGSVSGLLNLDLGVDVGANMDLDLDLDVYKRQERKPPDRHRDRSEKRLIPFDQPPEQAALPSSADIVPVSYTHLDVYKRQYLHQPQGPR